MKKQVKRAVSWVLALMLLLTCMPMSALAAGAPADITTPTDTSDSHIDIKLGVGKIPSDLPEITSEEDEEGATIWKYDGTKRVEFNQTNYALLGKTITTANKVLPEDKTDESYINGNNADNIAANVTKANGIFTMAKTYEVGKGETFWLGVKFSAGNLEANEYITGGSMWFGYDKSALEFPADSSNPTAFAETMRSKIIINNIDAGNIRATEANAKKFAPDSYGKLDAAQITMADGVFTENSRLHKAGDGAFNILITKNPKSKYPLPKNSTWDLLIPMKVKDNAAQGTYYIDIDPDRDITISNGKKNTTHELATGTLGALSGHTDNTNQNRATGNVVAITVTSNEASIAATSGYEKITAGDAATVRATLTNATVGTLAGASAWAVTSEDGGAATVNGVTKIDANTVELSLTNVTAGTLKITGTNPGFTPASGKTAPAGGWTFTTTAIAADAVVSGGTSNGYKLDANGAPSVGSGNVWQFSSQSPTDATKWETGALDITKLLAAIAKAGNGTTTGAPTGTRLFKGLIRVQATGNKGTAAYVAQDVVQYLAPAIDQTSGIVSAAPGTVNKADLFIDYEHENLYAGNGLMVKVGASNNTDVAGATAGKGTTAISLTSALNGSSGARVNAYTKGDATAVQSSVASYGFARPAAPTVTIADSPNKTSGKSMLTLPNGAKYVILPASAAAPTSVSALTETFSGTSAIEVALTTDQKVYAYLPGSNADKKFASAISAGVAGKGQAYNTVSYNMPAEGDKTIELVLTGPGEWDYAAGEVTIDGMTVTGATANGKTLTVTTTEAYAKGTDYKVTVKKEALSSANQKLGASGTENQVIMTFRLSANGVTFTVKDSDGNAVTANKSFFAPDTAAGEVTVTLDGKYIDSVAISRGSHATVAKGAGERPTKFTMTTDPGEYEVSDAVVTLTLAAVNPVLELPDAPASRPEVGDTTHAVWNLTNKADLGTQNTLTIDPASDGFSVVGDTVEFDPTGKTAGTYTATVKSANGGTATISIAVKTATAYPKVSGTKTWDGTTSVDLSQISIVDKNDSPIAGATAGGTVTTASSDVGEQTLVLTGLTMTGASGYELDKTGTYKLEIVKAAAATSASVTVANDNGFKGAKTIDQAAEWLLANAKVVPVTTGDVSDTAGAKPLGEYVDKATLVAKIREWAIADEAGEGADADAITEATATVDDPAYKIKAGKKIEVEIAQGDLKTGAVDSGYFTNISDPADPSTFVIPVAATLKKTSSGGGGWVPTVTLQPSGFGEPNGQVLVDGDGKITSLPGVINVKKGIFWAGWSTDGTKNHIVTEGRVLSGDTTLYPVYEGYMTGYTDGTAKPGRQVTRAELATMLVRATGDYDITRDYGKPSFTDAQVGWYVPYMACAEQAGILSGYPDGTGRPDAYVTRNEAVAMIAQAFNVSVSEDATTTKVSDFNELPDWARKFVATMCNNGSIGGYPDGTFKGNNNISRGESAQIINAYLSLSGEKKSAIIGNSSIVSPFSDVQDKTDWHYPNMIFATANAPADMYSSGITYPVAN